METYSCITSSSSNHRRHHIYSSTPRNLQSLYSTPFEAEPSMHTDRLLHVGDLNSGSTGGDHSGISSARINDDKKEALEAGDVGEDDGDYYGAPDEEERNGAPGGGGGGKKKTKAAVEMKKVRRPRFAFQTRSQIDVLDDGYRWRKYGQKAVKNNNFPRSYYRCTHQGCNVKKQVQRLSKDEEVVVTTYEGTHTHPIQTNTDNFEQILKQMQIYTTFS
ncbi:putative WRKY transcription factor 75 [Platanthera zijinensis]|uniref:WRKY transcription factor 75 n=1 Tax=Platanthera zijinensis TaxID=2320716 RepID=A0AAP0AVN7_9ASPA